LHDTVGMELASTHAETAWKRLAELSLPPTPTNFAVWYHYFTRTYPDLCVAVDAMIDRGEAITDDHCADLYDRFFTFETDGATVHEAAVRVEQALDRAAEVMNAAGADAADYTKTLAAAAGQLDDLPAEASFDDIVQTIVRETREMEVRTKELELRLETSTEEIQRLRKEVDSARREASTDKITGIANRKLFDVALHREATESAEAGTNLCLLVADIDSFGTFNEAHGHSVGDQVLKLFAHTITDSIKGRDIAARYGGDEFAVILPNTELRDAMTLAQNLREQLSSKRVVNKRTGSQLGSVTLSWGVAQYIAGEPLNRLTVRAEAALYLAKQQGRNRVMSETNLSKSRLIPGG